MTRYRDHEVTAIDAAAFTAIMAPYESGLTEGTRSGLAVGCSGGADSLALALLAAEWARERGVPFTALTVDHGLRDESAEEAEGVRKKLLARGIDAYVLKNGGGRPVSNLQSAARDIRYGLLLDWCRDNGFGALAVAHHLEDQAETFLLRLARGSGVDGLSAMAPAMDWGGVMILRPLLEISRAALRETLKIRGEGWVEDPSNEDDRFARIRMRKASESLTALGLDARTLAGTARRMARARRALEVETDRLLDSAGTIAPEGFIRLDAGALADAEEEIALRALSRVLCRVAGRFYAPRLEKLERLFDAIRDGALDGGRTLGGASVRYERSGGIIVCRENAAVNPRKVPLSERLLWDGRFLIGFEGIESANSGEFEVSALGRGGWSQLRRKDPEAGARGERLPAEVRTTLPALWHGDRIALAPHLQNGRPLIDGTPIPVTLTFAGPALVREKGPVHFSEGPVGTI